MNISATVVVKNWKVPFFYCIGDLQLWFLNLSTFCTLALENKVNWRTASLAWHLRYWQIYEYLAQVQSNKLNAKPYRLNVPAWEKYCREVNRSNLFWVLSLDVPVTQVVFCQKGKKSTREGSLNNESDQNWSGLETSWSRLVLHEKPFQYHLQNCSSRPA